MIYRGAQEIQDTSQGNHIIQRLREVNQAIAVPTLPTAGDGSSVAQCEEGAKGTNKDSAAEMTQAQASSTGNSSNHNNSAGSPPTNIADATTNAQQATTSANNQTLVNTTAVAA